MNFTQNLPPVQSYSVSDLTRYLRALLEMDDILRDVWVQGEVSNCSKPASGHIYFTLKDSGAALKCVIWRSGAAKMRINLQNGMAIEAHGGISVYERDGQYQLYVDAVRPVGEGFLFQEFIRLKARLEAEGLFEEERKRPIPARPECIGIVTSATGAALQDMLNTLRRRYPLAEVVLAPCAVQGDAAPAEIVAALESLCLPTLFNPVVPDVILIARGGGSLEDLWAFNDERVVRAVAGSPIPTITGVGHETDFTLCDFASDLRAPTPTGAAMLATPDIADLQAELGGYLVRLNQLAAERLAGERQELEFYRHRLERVSPADRIRAERQHLNEQIRSAERAITHTVSLEYARLQGLQARLQSLNPAAVLQRGFALVRTANGDVVRSVGQVQPGDALTIHLQDGELQAAVDSILTTQKENE